MPEKSIPRGGLSSGSAPKKVSSSEHFKVCPCGVHFQGAGQECQRCIARNMKQLEELTYLDGLISRALECEPANEKQIRGWL
jgi:hypothetical protein